MADNDEKRLATLIACILVKEADPAKVAAATKTLGHSPFVKKCDGCGEDVYASDASVRLAYTAECSFLCNSCTQKRVSAPMVIFIPQTTAEDAKNYLHRN